MGILMKTRDPHGDNAGASQGKAPLPRVVQISGDVQRRFLARLYVALF